MYYDKCQLVWIADIGPPQFQDQTYEWKILSAIRLVLVSTTLQAIQHFDYDDEVRWRELRWQSSLALLRNSCYNISKMKAGMFWDKSIIKIKYFLQVFLKL